jgi:hypothetical protein
MSTLRGARCIRRIIRRVPSTASPKTRDAIDALHKFIKLPKHLEFQHGIENRTSDGFYIFIGDNSNTDATEKKYVADQVKSAGIGKNGTANFHITVGEALQILLDGRSVTFIAMETPNDPDERWSVVLVVWFLYGDEACEMLKKFDKSQEIRPVVSPQRNSEHAFTKEFQSEKYRYNISEPAECQRLRDAKIEFAKNVNSRRETYEFWNENESQMGASHYKEQKIINAMNERLCGYGISAKKYVDDNYTKVDVRVILPDGRYSRVQSKMVTVGKTESQDKFQMCKPGGEPINLMVEIDGLDIYYATTNWVYSLPARVINPKTGEIEPYLTKKEMSKNTVSLSKRWKKKHSMYLCNLNDADGVRKYIAFQKERVLNRP